jgi:hypothetical protein
MEMKGHYLVTTGEWNSSLAESVIRTDDLDAGAQFTASLLDGYKLFHQKKSNDLSKHIEGFEKELLKATLVQKDNEGIAICGVTRYANAAPTKNEIKTANRYLNQLKGMRAWLQRDMKAAETFFKDALPESGSVVVGPPYFVLSPHEMYGNFLIDVNRPAEAVQQFDKALAASPKRYVALRGKLLSARALKDKSEVSKVKAQLQTMLKNADAAVMKDLSL